MVEPTTFEILKCYFLATVSYWWFLFVGVLMPLPDIYKHFHPQGKAFPLPRWVRWTASLLCLSLAQFLAYKNQTISLSTVVEEKRQFSLTINAQAGALQQAKSQLEGLRTKLPAPESRYSLRKRTMQLADELYGFLRERQQNHPPYAYPNSGDPNPSDERKQAIKISVAYDEETLDRYTRKYKDRMVGIIKEYESKGIPTGYLESAAKQRIPGWAAVGSGWEGSPQDELTLFRDLAYHVDAYDRAIHF